MTDSIERRPFRLDEAALSTVIFRQAGTLERAVTEAVQNAADAGATRVDVTVGPDALVIADDGRGFADRDEVVRGFEAFGRPHDADEPKEFGRFRMGRGQLFAFGLNVWRSRTVRMTVDAAAGLDYQLECGLPDRPGCEIRVTRRDPAVRFNDLTVGRLSEAVKWAAVTVTLNGRTVTTSRRAVTWDEETADGLIMATGGSSLIVYDRGYLVSTEHTADSSGAVLVSTRPLKLNFARNQVLQDCPVYRALTAAARRHTDAAVRAVQDAAAASARDRKRWRTRMSVDPHSAAHLPTLSSVDGRAWSVVTIGRLLRHYKRTVCLAPAGLPARERAGLALLMAAGEAIVLTAGWADAPVPFADVLRAGGVYISDSLVRRGLGELEELVGGRTADADRITGYVRRAALPAAGRVALRGLDRGLAWLKANGGVDTLVTGTGRWTPLSAYAVRPTASAGGPPVWCDGYRTLGVRADWLAAMTPTRWAAVAAVWAKGGVRRAPVRLDDRFPGATEQEWNEADYCGPFVRAGVELIRQATEEVTDPTPEETSDASGR